MKNLLIIGAGGCGREVMQWAKDINQNKPTWNIKGYLDDDKKALDGLRTEHKIIGTVNDYIPQVDDVFTCSIGNSEIRKRIIDTIENKGGEFISIIHPTAVVAETAELGKAEIIYPYVIISDNADIGDACIINMYSSVAHNSVLGNYCTISAHCDITGGCNVFENVFFGSGAKAVPGINIGAGAFVCAGSTVMSNIKPQIKVIGTPARKASF